MTVYNFYDFIDIYMHHVIIPFYAVSRKHLSACSLLKSTLFTAFIIISQLNGIFSSLFQSRLLVLSGGHNFQ